MQNLDKKEINLFDGELIRDKGNEFDTFYVFDVLVSKGENVMHMNLIDRLD